jgi:hypothetical protein
VFWTKTVRSDSRFSFECVTCCFGFLWLAFSYLEDFESTTVGKSAFICVEFTGLILRKLRGASFDSPWNQNMYRLLSFLHRLVEETEKGNLSVCLQRVSLPVGSSVVRFNKTVCSILRNSPSDESVRSSAACLSEVDFMLL